MKFFANAFFDMSYLFANVFAETMDHGRDEEQENILEDMIRDGDDVDTTSQFLNDSGEGVEGEADDFGS